MLIIDIPMPTRCDRCPCALVIDGMWYCKAFDDSTPIYGNLPRKRRDWCPIKGELPDEHGDLIDRDKFVDKYIRHYTEQERKMNLVFAAVEVKQDFADMIYEEDAVIEAERKDDD